MQRATVFAVILAMSFAAVSVWSTAQEESTAKATVHITLFDDQVEEKFLGMLEWFTAETGWPAEVVPAPGGQDYFTTNATRLATGEGPDILIGHGTPAEYLVYNPKQNFVDITDWARDNLVGTKVPEAVMAANAVDGRNFGIPYSPITLRGYLYNKDLAQAAGVTVPASTGDFLENVAPKVRAAGFDPLYAMGQSAWSLGFVADNFVADEFVLTDVQDRINNNETSFAETGMVRAFEYIKEIGDRGYFNADALVGTTEGQYAALREGTVYAAMGSVNSLPNFTEEFNNTKLGGFNISEQGNRAYYSLPWFAYLVKEEAGGDDDAVEERPHQLAALDDGGVVVDHVPLQRQREGGGGGLFSTLERVHEHGPERDQYQQREQADHQVLERAEQFAAGHRSTTRRFIRK